MGYRDITLFGADSSFDDSRYCYQDGTFQEDSKAQPKVVQIGDEYFFTEDNLIKQVANLGVMADQFKGILKFECDGLIAAYLRLNCTRSMQKAPSPDQRPSGSMDRWSRPPLD